MISVTPSREHRVVPFYEHTVLPRLVPWISRFYPVILIKTLLPDIGNE